VYSHNLPISIPAKITIENTSLLTINNDGTINNGVGGEINNNEGTINNNESGLILNEGVIFNGGESIINEGTIINQCTGTIEGEIPDDRDGGITFNRSCNGPLYSISVGEGASILEIDPTTGEEISSFGVSEASSGWGLATNPLTGELWALVDSGGAAPARFLSTIDPAIESSSFEVLVDGALTDIAFDSSGTLFGVTEQAATESRTGTLVEIDTTTGTTTELCDFNDGESRTRPNTIGFNFADGFLYRAVDEVQEGAFQKITDTSGEECVTVDQVTEGVGGDNYQALTWGAEEEKFFAADDVACCSLFDMILDGADWVVSKIGEFTGILSHTSHGLAFVPFEPAPPVAFSGTTGGGGGTYEDPTIGLNNKGMPMVKCGVMFDITCFDITSKFHYEFELYEMMSGTHTISITTFCSQGVDTCNYVALAIMPYSKDINEATWKIELHKDHLGNLTPVIIDPEGYLGEVTVTSNVRDGKFWIVSFTIEFKNKDTDPMKFGIQVRDNKHGVQNTYLNEGVQFKDAHAYPYIETAFEAPLEVEPLCIGEDVFHRGNCAFDKVKEWATNNAEETMRQIMNNEYTYK